MPPNSRTQANFLISFYILTNALEDKAVLGGKVIEVINVILTYAYVGLLLTCFVLALGNRPQGSKWGYTLAFVGFAILTCYMTVRVPPPSYASRKDSPSFCSRLHVMLTLGFSFPRSPSLSAVCKLSRPTMGTRRASATFFPTRSSATWCYLSRRPSGCTCLRRLYTYVVSLVHLWASPG
jgi:hypothetical protein